MRVLLIRPDRNESDAAALLSAGIESEIDPYLTIESSNNASGADRMLQALRKASGSSNTTWFICTSTHGFEYFEAEVGADALAFAFSPESKISFAAVGPQTAALFRERGAESVLVPEQADSESLAKIVLSFTPGTAVIPRGSIALDILQTSLLEGGFDVVSEVVYLTKNVPSTPRTAPAVADGAIDAVLLRSPSAARAFALHNPNSNLPAVAAGATTATEAKRLGINLVATSHSPSAQAVAETFLDLRGALSEN